MIDIHCHLLFGVDDGAKTIKDSIAMLQDVKKQGVDAMILTPHYRHGMFAYDRRMVDTHFQELLAYAKQAGMRIYPGCEYHVNSKITDYIRSGRCHTMADTNYVLMEYSYETEYSYIESTTREMIFRGYIPVVAHVERYACMMEEPSNAAELRKAGALVQVNCDAVLGLDGRRVKKYTKRLLTQGWVDFLASDCHGLEQRACHMGKCYDYVTKKYGEDVARRLMETNPNKILTSRASFRGER